MHILVTGAAGFIGMHTSLALLKAGVTVTGIDNLNQYYDIQLKKDRLELLARHQNFNFLRIDLSDSDKMTSLFEDNAFCGVIHLGAQAGVRYSIQDPRVYATANLVGHLNILEGARACPTVKHVVYASSSSVYGANTTLPFRETDRVDHPVSLYAATKRADELISQSYAHLYDIPLTGLRFFTVYGPWGRPDMAPWLFTEHILTDKPIRIFNQGNMGRDFTYIDDIVDGIIRALHTPAKPNPDQANAPHKIYNIGNNKPERLMDFIHIIEKATGRTAVKEFEDMQPGDVQETYADISAITNDLGYNPATGLDTGLPQFVNWYRDYKKL